jgi:TPP-dependent trihydroxycyclohexane-1,2-dione (THcHDO) dehydratase
MERRIFFFGRNAAMMALVGQQLSAAGMDAEGYMDEEQLSERLKQGGAGLLVIGGGVEDAARQRLKDLCAAHGVMVLEHHAGPGTLPESITGILG